MELLSLSDRGDLLLKSFFAASGPEFSQLSLKAGQLVDCGSTGVANDHFNRMSL